MENFEIFIDITSPRFFSELHRGENVLCDFHLAFNGQSFPSSPWLDFPLTVLPWWIEAYRDLVTNERVAVCSFMNGPFEFTVSRRAALELRFWQRTAQKDVEVGPAIELTRLHFENSLRRASEKLIEAVFRHSPEDRRVRDLRNALETFLHNDH